MRFLRATALLPILLHHATAVSVKLYVANTKDCNGNVAYECSDLAENDCCAGGGRYGSALFTGLVTEGVPAQGIVYNYVQLDDGTLENCGNSCNAGAGLDLCLSCDDTNPAGPFIDGANWIFPASPKWKRDAIAQRECNPVKPDLLTLKGRSFHINRDVPEMATVDLMALAERSAEGEEIEVPEHLLAYEVV